MTLEVGDIIKMKKSHPCGSSEWEILRIGMDVRLRCCGCAHMILVSRKQAEKSIKELVKRPPAGDQESSS